jgi:hypothetical protein
MSDAFKSKMIAYAISRFGSIVPVTGLKYLSDCFSISDDELWFWYNDKSGSTHLIRADASSGKIING